MEEHTMFQYRNFTCISVNFSLYFYYMMFHFNQGTETYPAAISLKILFWFMFFFSLIIFTSYSATLVSLLTVVKPAPLPFSNMFELSKLKDWDAGNYQNDLFEVVASVRFFAFFVTLIWHIFKIQIFYHCETDKSY